MLRSEQSIRVGLIGYGFAGKTFHAPLIQSVPGLILTHVSSSQREKIIADLPTVSVCPEGLEVATHRDIDLVVVASPNSSHFPLAAAALNAGKDVVVDKPFTVTLSEAQSLAELAEKRGRFLAVFHNRRWESESLGCKGDSRIGTAWRYIPLRNAHRSLQAKRSKTLARRCRAGRRPLVRFGTPPDRSSAAVVWPASLDKRQHGCAAQRRPDR